MIITASTAFAQTVYTPVLTSDKPDYAPLSTAVFYGVGYQPFEQVILKVKNISRPCNTVSADSSYLPWTVQANSSGAFTTTWTVCDCAGDSLRLKGTGVSSAAIAYLYFKDSPKMGSMSITTQSPNPVVAGNSAGYTLTVNRGNESSSGGNINFTYAITWPNTPAGVTVNFNPALGDMNANQNTVSNQMTITTTGATAGGSYPFTITASATASDFVTVNGTLIVQNNCTAPSITSCPSNVITNTDGDCNKTVTYSVGSSGTAPISYSYVLTGATTGSGSGTGSGLDFNKGITQVAVTASNACGTAVCNFTITVNDIQKPTITAPANVTVNTDNNSCSATGVSLGNATADDNCDGETVSNNAPSTFPKGVTVVTWTVTDASGNTATATQTVTVNDIQKPTITAPANVTVNTDNNSCSATGVSLGNATADDNCDGETVSNNAPSTFPKGVTVVTWTVTDASGNTATATQTVTVNDIQKPTITAPANVTVNTDNNSCSATSVSLGNATADDNCDGETVSNNAPSTFPKGVTVVTWTVTDASGNTETATQTVTVNDIQKPNAICKSFTLNLDATGNATLVSGDINNGSTDNCGIAAYAISQSAFNCTHIGNNTVILTVTDLSGNTGTCSATVLVKDVTAPTALAKNITVDLDASGNATITGSDVNNGSTDVCGAVTLSVTPSTFNCSNISAGSTGATDLIISEYVEGSSNNKALEIYNGTLSTINLSGYTINQYFNGQTSSTPIALIGSIAAGSTFVIANSSANATIIGKAQQTSGALMFNGDDAVILAKNGTVIDAIGQIGFDPGTQWGTLLVSTEDNTIRRKSTVVSGYTNTSSAFNPSTQWDGFATDEASGLGTHTMNTVSSGVPVVLTVTDASGNTSSANAVVIVKDVTAPTVLTQNITVQLNSSGNATITAAQINNGSTDACGISTLTVSPSSFNCSNVGANTVTLTVTDVNGNIGTGTATVTVQDKVAPVVVTKNIIVQLNSSGTVSIAASEVNNGSNDACGIASMTVSPNNFTCINVGDNTVTLTVTDANGNTSSATATVTVRDNIAPTAITKNITVQLDASGLATINASQVNNGSFDNCGPVSLSVSPSTFNCASTNVKPTDLFISEYVEGSGNIKAIEIYNGTAASINLSAYSIRFYSNGSTSIGTTIPLSGTVASGEVFVLATSTASAAILAQADQTSVASFYNGNDAVTLAKNSVNIDIFGRIGEDPGAGGWTGAGGYATTDRTLQRRSFVNRGISINPSSGFPTLTTEWNVFPIDEASGIGSHSTTPNGNNLVTLTVTDANGNSSSATATVTVEDKVAPVVITKNITVQLNAAGTVSIAASDVNNGSNDACGIAAMTVSPNSFTCANVGNNTVTLTVVDVNGNTSTNTATVTVQDKVAPVVITKNITVQLNAAGTVSIVASDVNNGSSDACGIATMSVSPNSFTCSNVGNNTVTLTVVDVNGNTSTNTATVTVQDKVAPVVITKNITVQLNAAGTVSIAASDVNNGSNDACGIATMSVSPNSFTCANVGNNTVTLTVVDVNGNTATNTAIVTVQDKVAPVITCPASITIHCQDSRLPAKTGSATATDACGIATITYNDVSTQNASNTSAGHYNYTITRTWLATDNNGNTSTCVQIITVRDVTAPVIACVSGSPISKTTNTGACSYKVVGLEFNATATDNCATSVLIYSYNISGATNLSGIGSLAGKDLNFGMNTIEWTATDPSGNTSTCTIQVHVNAVATTTTVTVNPGERQYSDVVTFVATVTNCDRNARDGWVNFSVNGYDMGSAQVQEDGTATLIKPLLEASLHLGTPPSGLLMPSDTLRTVIASFVGINQSLASFGTTTLKVKDEDAIPYYTGSTFVSTSTTSTSTASVLLSATIKDISAVAGSGDDAPGDIRNARVRFVNRDIGVGLTGYYLSGWLTPGLVNSNDTKTGVVNATWVASIGSNDAQQFTIGVIVDNGYYYRNSSDDNTVITVSKPLSDFVTGGGYIIMSDATGAVNPGLGKKNNFGFNIKRTKNGVLQGNINTIIRTADNKVIQIKGNAMTSLSVQPSTTNSPAKAVFVGKANIQDITDPNNVQSIAGNQTLQVSMTDRGEPGFGDDISILVYRDANVYFSSNWNGTSTILQELDGGNIKIHSTGSHSTGTTSSNIVVVSNNNPSLVGQQVIFTATVTGSGTIKPTGTVNFVNLANNAVLGNVAVNTTTGIASLTVGALPAGLNQIAVYYSGDSRYSPSGNSMNQVVNAPTTSRGETEVPANVKPVTTEVPEVKLSVAIGNNPAPDRFTLQVRTTSSEPVHIRVVDFNGRPVENLKLPAGNTLTFGQNYKAGSYFLQVRQGKKSITEKLIKL